MSNDELNPKDVVGRKKDPIHLVSTEAIRLESHAMRYGAHEAKRADGKFGYGEYNWRDTKVAYTVYISAIMRHCMKILDGEDIDKDSGCHHLAHIRAGAGIVIDAEKEGTLVDDRPKRKELKGRETNDLLDIKANKEVKEIQDKLNYSTQYRGC